MILSGIIVDHNHDRKLENYDLEEDTDGRRQFKEFAASVSMRMELINLMLFLYDLFTS